MKLVPASLLAIALVTMPVNFPACAEDAQANGVIPKAESARILAEGDRIKQEADLMRSEATRLDSEADELQKGAAYLDQLWEKARKLDPNQYKDYAGRNRSQRRMRLDAVREKRDAVSLRMEGRRLDAEAVRLWKLAAAVDPQALKDLLDRLRNCCKLQTELSGAHGSFRRG
jgi:DNA-binding helix-hairpin-helix protein with protein kinase domain